MGGRSHLVRSRIRIPALAPAVIPRGRVVGELAREAEGRRVLKVVASAGSGKTTAVVEFLASRPGPRAWLTVGEGDGSPGRFVSYLAGALDAIDPEASAGTAGLLAAGVPPADCAAILVESLPEGATLVIDDLHLMEDRPPILAVVRSLVEAAPPGALVVLISRRLVAFDLSRAFVSGTSGRVTGRELAFTPDEIRAVLDLHDAASRLDEIAERSGGWAAGIVFDALRDPDEGAARGPRDDPFFEYLGAEVLAPLPPDLRRTVVRSALLEIVEPAALGALLGTGSGDAALRAIGRHHLPAAAEPEGLRYHPRFREFLLSLLRDDPEEYAELLVRDARRLAATGHEEEAADRLVEAGVLDEAATMVAIAGPRLLARGDAAKVDEWCGALGEERLAADPALRGLHLASVVTVRRHTLAALAQRLVESGEYARLVVEAPDAATVVVWGLHQAGNWDRVADLVPPDDASQTARALRLVLHTGGGTTAPPRPWTLPGPAGPGDDPDAEWPHDETSLNLVRCAFVFGGRLRDAVDAGRIVADPASPMRATGAPLYLVAALTRLERLGDARALTEVVRPYFAPSGFGDFWLQVEGQLAFAEGARDEGLAMVGRARAAAHERGHEVAARGIFAAIEGEMLTRLGRHDEAVAGLRETIAWCAENGVPCFGEWASAWLGHARLGRGDDPAEVRDGLEQAIAAMERAGRLLERPAALVALAEARWRLGDEAGHDAAAARALDAAEAMGTYAPLLTALREMPDVLSRCIDAGGEHEALWRSLARAGEPPRAPGDTEHARVVLRTLGRLHVTVDGVEREIAPPRALDVALEVARAGTRGVSRAALVALLAPHSADAPNYLRQLVHRLRQALPEGVALASDGGRLRWEPAGAVVAEDDVLRALLARVPRETGARRLDALAAALRVAERGPLADGGEALSGEGLRAALDAAVAEARREHARLALAANRTGDAVASARAAVVAEPLREDGWRLLMAAATAVEGVAAAGRLFAECVASLGSVGLAPSAETRALLEDLRRGGTVSAPA